MMFYILSNYFLFLQTFFLLFQLEQPIAVADSCFLRMFSLFSRLFFTFPDDELLLQLLDFVLIYGISGCLWCLGTQLHFSRMFLIPRPSFQASRTQAGRHSLCQYFSKLLCSIFPDHLCGCFHHHLITHRCLTYPILFLQTETVLITYISLSCLSGLACSAHQRYYLSIRCNCHSDPHKGNRWWKVTTSAVITAHRCQASLLPITCQWFVYQNLTMAYIQNSLGTAE